MNPLSNTSFKDPSGQVFMKHGVIYRGIQPVYRKEYLHLMNSGLYTALTEQQLLIPHQKIHRKNQKDYFLVVKPTQIPFISYPYEWCFDQFKDAALATLKVQKISLMHDMILRDASAYNVQFFAGKPILIDTLSFKIYEDGQPWPAYRQFCMHFLAPLLLMKYKSRQFSKLLRIFLDGVPLNIASALLPIHTWFHPAIVLHLHLHAKSQQYFADKAVTTKSLRMEKHALIKLIENLEAFICRLSLKLDTNPHTWLTYYEKMTYTKRAFAFKKAHVRSFLQSHRPTTVWDVGANTGTFSYMAAAYSRQTVSFDMDPDAIEQNYRYGKTHRITNCLPLLLDLTNPSPSIGFNHQERMSLVERGPVDMVLALALIHHLAIANNIPLVNLASFFSQLCRHLVIEFIPKEDPNVQQLLANRTDIFDRYTPEDFEATFVRYFFIKKKTPIIDSKRILYLMENKRRLL